MCAQLVIICCLQHKEIGALFSVCRELRATVRRSALAVTLTLSWFSSKCQRSRLRCLHDHPKS